MTNLSQMTDQELQRAKREAEFAYLHATIQTASTDELIQLMELIEADKQQNIEARYAAVAAKFEAEEGRKG
jgi:hypothetical protein